MKLLIENWKKFVISEDINEGGAMMHWRDYQMQRILDPKEALHVLEELTRFVKKNADYSYPRPGYGEALGLLQQVRTHIQAAAKDKEENPIGKFSEE